MFNQTLGYWLCAYILDLMHLFLFSFWKVLCKSHPVEFASYFHYCHSLTFDQRPDYGFLKRLFRDLFAREGSDASVYISLTVILFERDLRTVMMPKYLFLCRI